MSSPAGSCTLFEKGFDGVFIADDGSDCPFGESCTEKTGEIVRRTHELMKQKSMEPARLRMAAICSVCIEDLRRKTGELKRNNLTRTKRQPIEGSPNCSVIPHEAAAECGIPGSILHYFLVPLYLCGSGMRDFQNEECH